MSNSTPEPVVVLLVDPEAQSREQIRSVFSGSGHTFIEAHTVVDALELVDRHQPALVMSELGLPDGSGFSLCRQLRDSGNSVRVMMVSRWAREGDRILAFECGADDFLAKPFFARELASRVRAVLGRSAEIGSPARTAILESQSYTTADLSIDPNLHTIKLSGRPLALTPREYSLLRTLVEGRGRVFSRSELVAHSIGDQDPPGIRTVDAHIKSIRRKLGPMGVAIETVRGAGYRYAGSRSRGGSKH